MAGITDEQKQYSVLQTATKYTNDYWMQFGQDMVAYCTDQMEAEQVLSNMDENRATAARCSR